jgi:uncharacterized membrane protein
MATFCASCGAQMADNAATCPACGKAGAAGGGGAATPAASGGLDDNIAALLGYLFWPLAIVWLLMDPYKSRPFVRFNAFQTLALVVSLFVAVIATFILGIVFAFIPYVGPILSLLLMVAVWGGAVVTWIICIVKAYQNQKWQIPVIGGIAQKMAGG